MIMVDVVPVFDVPNGREHSLREAPAQRTLLVQRERVRENLEPAFDRGAIREEFELLDGVSQQSTDLVFDFADDAFRIDRGPTAFVIVEHVVVLQIAVQEHRRALC